MIGYADGYDVHSHAQVRWAAAGHQAGSRAELPPGEAVGGSYRPPGLEVVAPEVAWEEVASVPSWFLLEVGTAGTSAADRTNSPYPVATRSGSG